MPLNYAQLDHRRDQFAAQYEAWLAEQTAQGETLRTLFRAAAEDPELLRRAIEDAEQQQTNLYLAKPTSEPILSHIAPLPAPPRYTLIAADGSQIAPSRHRALQFAIVNVGLIKAQIGSGEPPETWIETDLLGLDQVISKDGMLMSEDEVALQRDLAERKLIRQAITSEDIEPIITLTDGPLDVFYRSTIQGDRGEQVQREVFEIDQNLRERKIMTAGYIDKPGSAMISRMLALFSAAREGVPFDPQKNELNLSDRVILREILSQPGERSAVFEAITRKPNKPVNSLPVAFFYLNVSGIPEEPCLARVEFPLWMFETPGLVEQLHSVVYKEAQVLDSHPYPYLLHRAHELAVVRRIEADEIEAQLQSQLDPRLQTRLQRSNKDYLKGLS